MVLKAWVPVPIPTFYNPVASLLVPHGKGWLASVTKIAGKKAKVVHFVCDGEEESVSMKLDDFRATCKSIA